MVAVQPLRTSGDTQTLEQSTTRTQRPWLVVVWNDPVTPMKVVVVIFRKIFGYSNNKATQLMLQVHHEGRAVVWSGERERAQGYCVKLQSAGLLSTIEQES
jgi:ATP-dependent Clp protease adaptor protein ClpS